MVANTRPTELSEEEAQRLVERLMGRAVPTYLIRDELIDRGYTAYAANAIIERVRKDTQQERINNPDDMRTLVISLGLFVGLIFIIVVLLLLSGS